jgi:hypothetical protein
VSWGCPLPSYRPPDRSFLQVQRLPDVHLFFGPSCSTFEFTKLPRDGARSLKKRVVGVFKSSSRFSIQMCRKNDLFSQNLDFFGPSCSTFEFTKLPRDGARSLKKRVVGVFKSFSRSSMYMGRKNDCFLNIWTSCSCCFGESVHRMAQVAQLQRRYKIVVYDV